MKDEKYLQLAKNYTDEKIKEQEAKFLNQIMAGHEVKHRSLIRSWKAIILSFINLLLWIFTVAAFLIYLNFSI